MPPLDLHLDRKNPRIPDTEFEDEDSAIQYLARYGALDELISSIASSGWLDFEPLIVLKRDESGLENVVIEGNRRLAALKLLADPDLAKRRDWCKIR